tara:strand:+ start:3820 stop:4242 length:423 start_codon:yes stop_codon:yes gene_type:complete
MRKLQEIQELGQDSGVTPSVYGKIKEVTPVKDGRFFIVSSTALNARNTNVTYITILDSDLNSISGIDNKGIFNHVIRKDISKPTGFVTSHFTIDSNYKDIYAATDVIKSIFGYDFKVKPSDMENVNEGKWSNADALVDLI